MVRPSAVVTVCRSVMVSYFPSGGSEGSCVLAPAMIRSRAAEEIDISPYSLATRCTMAISSSVRSVRTMWRRRRSGVSRCDMPSPSHTWQVMATLGMDEPPCPGGDGQGGSVSLRGVERGGCPGHYPHPGADGCPLARKCRHCEKRFLCALERGYVLLQGRKPCVLLLVLGRRRRRRGRRLGLGLEPPADARAQSRHAHPARVDLALLPLQVTDGRLLPPPMEPAHRGPGPLHRQHLGGRPRVLAVAH